MSSSDDLTLILVLTPCFLHEFIRWFDANISINAMLSTWAHPDDSTVLLAVSNMLSACAHPDDSTVHLAINTTLSMWAHQITVLLAINTTLSTWAHQIIVLLAINTTLSTWAHQITVLLAINTTLSTWAHQITVLLAINTTLSMWAQMTPLCCWLYKPCFLHELVRWLQCKLETVNFIAREFIWALVHEMSTASWTTSLQCSLCLGVKNDVCMNMSVTWLDALCFLFCAKTLLAVYQFILYLSSVCRNVLVSWTACGQNFFFFFFWRACFISLTCENPPHWIWCIDIQFVLTTAVFILPAQLTLYHPDVTFLVDWA